MMCVVASCRILMHITSSPLSFRVFPIAGPFVKAHCPSAAAPPMDHLQQAHAQVELEQGKRQQADGGRRGSRERGAASRLVNEISVGLFFLHVGGGLDGGGWGTECVRIESS